MRSNNESGYRGVHRSYVGDKKWCVRFNRKYYGFFDDPVEASKVYERVRDAWLASDERAEAVARYKAMRKATPAWNKGLRKEPKATGSVAQQMLAQYKRRLLKGEQEGWT